MLQKVVFGIVIANLESDSEDTSHLILNVPGIPTKQKLEDLELHDLATDLEKREYR